MERAQAGDLAGERRRGLLDLRVERDLGEAPGLAGELDVQRGHLVLGGRVDEERRGVVEELVADRALHGPVAQGLAGVEDLLDPDVLDPALAQALAGSRPGRPGRRGGRRAGRPGRRRPRARGPCRGRPRRPRGPRRGSPRGRRCRRSAGTSRCRGPSRRSARAARSSAHQRFSSETPMWFGTMSSTIPRPRARSARRPSSPPRASLTRRRVDDVVAVARPGAGLQRRGEVEVRDPEVGQVGDELPDRGEVLLGRELEPVRRAEGAHRTRRRTFSDRAGDVDVRARA